MGCSKIFTSNRRLSAHSRSHTSKISFRCNYPLCNKVFVHQGNHERHVKAHIKIEGLSCQCHVCGKEFSKREFLLKHEQKHDSLKKYGCITCGKEFLYASSQRKHIRYHCPGPSKIKDSSASHWTNAASDTETKNLHELDQRFYHCNVPYCRQVFIRLGNLERHCKTIHPKMNFKLLRSGNQRLSLAACSQGTYSTIYSQNSSTIPINQEGSKPDPNSLQESSKGIHSICYQQQDHVMQSDQALQQVYAANNNNARVLSPAKHAVVGMHPFTGLHSVYGDAPQQCTQAPEMSHGPAGSVGISSNDVRSLEQSSNAMSEESLPEESLPEVPLPEVSLPEVPFPEVPFQTNNTYSYSQYKSSLSDLSSIGQVPIATSLIATSNTQQNISNANNTTIPRNLQSRAIINTMAVVSNTHQGLPNYLNTSGSTVQQDPPNNPSNSHIDNMISNSHIDNMNSNYHIDNMNSNSHIDNMNSNSHIDNMNSNSHIDNMNSNSHIENMNSNSHIDNMISNSHIDNMNSNYHIDNMNSNSHIDNMNSNSHIDNMNSNSHIDNMITDSKNIRCLSNSCMITNKNTIDSVSNNNMITDFNNSVMATTEKPSEHDNRIYIKIVSSLQQELPNNVKAMESEEKNSLSKTCMARQIPIISHAATERLNHGSKNMDEKEFQPNNVKTTTSNTQQKISKGNITSIPYIHERLPINTMSMVSNYQQDHLTETDPNIQQIHDRNSMIYDRPQYRFAKSLTIHKNEFQPNENVKTDSNAEQLQPNNLFTKVPNIEKPPPTVDQKKLLYLNLHPTIFFDMAYKLAAMALILSS